jgi:predicted ATP-dependent protease
MKYEKMTKEELIKKLEEQKHLAHAVESKDREIARILKRGAEEKQKYHTSLKLLKEQVAEKELLIKESFSKEQFKEEVDKVWKEAQLSVDKANAVLNGYTKALRLLNAALDMVNENDRHMSEKLKK